ncbi:hypothetical protein BTO05_09425 [Winogradskyella sp. PC-19]|uniref:hypothetical protein n=1 Tax=Winogradskyella sp. PC-19 TaxID=754417 RepID=UPI000B3C0E29|nr:hypothetical protein [Winogradskyella sp. PC-19]ARV09851.1 hypothetical protein BTO05_09425 [Winogradskyella sp. PC-19]
MNNNILKLKLKRIDPVKYALIASILTVLIMLIVFVPMMLLFSAIGLGAASSEYGSGAGVFGALLGSGVFIILVPIFYGVLVFIITLISSSLLNFILKKTGGLDIDFEKAGLDISQPESFLKQIEQ